jgi:hypothetical protein
MEAAAVRSCDRIERRRSRSGRYCLDPRQRADATHCDENDIEAVELSRKAFKQLKCEKQLALCQAQHIRSKSPVR